MAIFRRKTRTRRRGARLRWGLGPFLGIGLFTVVTTTAGIYQVYSQYQVIRMAYVLDQDLFELRRATETHKRLNLSIASYKHPLAVQTLARDALDMHAPTVHEELIVPSGAAPEPPIGSGSVPWFAPEPDDGAEGGSP